MLVSKKGYQGSKTVKSTPIKLDNKQSNVKLTKSIQKKIDKKSKRSPIQGNTGDKTTDELV